MGRITAEAKQRTRQRILDAARGLFDERGFEGASTRELSRRAEIAAGTLFNYFPTKEALALTIVGEALDRGTEAYLEGRRGETLEEDLFAHLAAALGELGATRGYLAEVLETALSPFVTYATVPESEGFRVRHLEAVDAILHRHGRGGASPVSMHLYWTLVLGVLAYWARDDSPREQDTLEVLDRSMRLFVRSLDEDPTRLVFSDEIRNGNGPRTGNGTRDGIDNGRNGHEPAGRALGR